MPPAERIERYELLGELATGGMATVYLGRQRGPFGFARTVAIKSMHPQFAKDEGFRAMFLDEATITARVRHPNVVPTLDVVAASTRLVLVMEYVEGISLSSLMRQAKKQDVMVAPPVAVAIMCDVLHGLHAAHELRDDAGGSLDVIHRDVSPQNILVGVDGVSRILDFGVAKATTKRYVTQTNEIKGKLAYMSPQQVRGEPIDRRTDLYAAGVVLWEVLTGKRLFPSSNDAELVKKVVDEVIVPPGFVAEQTIPLALDNAVMKALAKDAGSRWNTGEAMAKALADSVTPAARSEVTALVTKLGAEELLSRAHLLQDSSRVELEPDAKVIAEVLTAEATQAQLPSARAQSVVRSRRLTMLGSALVLVALIGVAFFVGLRGARSASRSGPAVAADTPIAALPPGLTPASASVETAIHKSGEPSFVIPSASSSSDALRVRSHRPVVSGPRPRVAKDCSIPYTIDARGDRHFKPECVE